MTEVRLCFHVNGLFVPVRTLQKDLQSYEDYMVTLREVHQEIIKVSGEDNVETALTRFDNGKYYWHNLPLQFSDGSVSNRLLFNVD